MQPPAHNHPAFQEVAEHVDAIVQAIETKYTQRGDNGRLVVHNILEALAAFLALYATERLLPPAAAFDAGERLNTAIAQCLDALLEPTDLDADFDRCPWPPGRRGTA